ncbi:MAG: carbon-phosphorus lyase complex subunit PhnI [Treponemataceae bacterium]|nr:carbon-phosphorus lyase complex subunit PhnI [Treponemataceae bacterium]
MGYVAVRGGREAIDAAIEQLEYERLKQGIVLDISQISAGLRALVDQVMAESSLWAPLVAAVALKQAEGNPEEAVFLLRAFRSTLPRTYYSEELRGETMVVYRRISACFKDIPGGQRLGPSCDYTHRLIDFSLIDETAEDAQRWVTQYLRKFQTSSFSEEKLPQPVAQFPRVSDYLRKEGLLSSFPPDATEPKDVTKKSLSFPTHRSERLQILSRAQTGALISFGYAALRGYGFSALHPTVGELRYGILEVYVPDPRTDSDACGDPENAYYVGEFFLTEVETLIPVIRDKEQGKKELEFTLGYGACFGKNETKAIAMSILDYCLEARDTSFPTGDEEFVLYHVDSVESSGFVSHLKLPHYVTFQSKLDSVRKTRKEKYHEKNL